MNTNNTVAIKNIADEVFSNEVIYNLTDMEQEFNEEYGYVSMSTKGSGKKDRASRKSRR